MVKVWIVDIETQTLKTPLKKIGEKVFDTEKEALDFYYKNKRNGFPWTIHCYPRCENRETIQSEREQQINASLAQFKREHKI